jgi:hypothetical protein
VAAIDFSGQPSASISAEFVHGTDRPAGGCPPFLRSKLVSTGSSVGRLGQRLAGRSRRARSLLLNALPRARCRDLSAILDVSDGLTTAGASGAPYQSYAF